MILDHLNQSAPYKRLHPGIAAALAFLHRSDLAQLPDGRYDIDGDRVYAMISHPATRGREGAKLEAHRQYFDVHLVLDGCEEIGWRSTPRCQMPDGEYDPQKDCALFHDAPDSWCTLSAGHLAIFSPADAHLPMVGEGTLHKVVIKIAV